MTPNDTCHFRIGMFECVVIHDYSEVIVRGLEGLFSNIEKDVWQAAKQALGENPNEYALSYNCLAINTGQQWILIDTGSGVLRDGTKLRTVLHREGIVPDSIIITHAHLDHYGGLVDADGQPVYPDAEVYICEDEWAYYTSDAYLGESEERSAVLRKHFLGAKDQVKLIPAETTIVPGIRTFPAPGHTMHHIAVWVESQDDKLLVAADVYPHILHLIHPDWHFFRDADHELSRQTRIKLAEMAIETNALVHSFHFDWPGLGHIVETDDHYDWRFITTD